MVAFILITLIALIIFIVFVVVTFFFRGHDCYSAPPVNKRADYGANDARPQYSRANGHVAKSNDYRSRKEEANESVKPEDHAKAAIFVFILHRSIEATLLASLRLFSNRYNPAA